MSVSRARPTPDRPALLAEWIDLWHETGSAGFLIGVARQRINEAQGYVYRDGLRSQPVTATGQDSYVRRDGNNLNRWGDYSSNEYDWTTGHFWGDIEYAWTSNSWRTRVTAVTAGSEAPFSAIDVTYPNGGETFNQGDSVLVTWSAANIDPAQDLYVWLWDGLWYQQSGPLASTTTSFLWTVPGIATTTGRIYVGAWNGAGYDPDDFSDGVFTIIPAGHIFSDGFESGTTSAWIVP